MGVEWQELPHCFHFIDLPLIKYLQSQFSLSLLASHEVLDLSPGISHVGHVQLPLLGCLFLAWFLVFIGLSFGLRSWGKVTLTKTLSDLVNPS